MFKSNENFHSYFLVIVIYMHWYVVSKSNHYTISISALQFSCIYLNISDNARFVRVHKRAHYSQINHVYKILWKRTGFFFFVHTIFELFFFLNSDIYAFEQVLSPRRRINGFYVFWSYVLRSKQLFKSSFSSFILLLSNRLMICIPEIQSGQVDECVFIVVFSMLL